jgi:DNA integrity scanning protein DisA with diadenylate cyclase activity
VIYLWTNYLSIEGKNIARRAEKAKEAGDFILARELYLKAGAKFKEVSEICDNFNEINIQRDLANYYYNLALKLEKDVDASAFEKKPQPMKQESQKMPVPELLKGTEVNEHVFEAVLKIALEISGEGREGRTIGTAFIIGDTANIMAKSRQLILNPFEGHKKQERMITDPETQDNIKEFAQLDGVFVISGDGVVEAAGRYITIDTGGVKIQRGLGTRHSSVAAMTSVTKSIAIVVSQSGGVIRIFRDGKIAATLKP